MKLLIGFRLYLNIGNVRKRKLKKKNRILRKLILNLYIYLKCLCLSWYKLLRVCLGMLLVKVYLLVVLCSDWPQWHCSIN